MDIVMTAPEVMLLTAYLRRTSNYLEFGTGGSAVLANKLKVKYNGGGLCAGIDCQS